MPPLRERPVDILPIARHFLRAYGGDFAPALDEGAGRVLLSHPWPGNVRELENCVKRLLALLPAGETVTAEALAELLENSPSLRERERESDVPGIRPGSQLRAQMAEADRREILDALGDAQGNKSRAAENLGVSRKTLYARMRRLGLEVE